jgi:hypothetical protein
MKLSESRMRQLIREELDSLPGYSPASPDAPPVSDPATFTKGEWELLAPGDARREAVKKDLYDLVTQTYAGIGGHIKVSDPQSLERYNYWLVADLDDDPEIDIGIFGKPDIGGNKLGGVGHDGSGSAKTAYKEKSTELRSGGSVGGVGNWWGEVSGGPAAALIKRGAPSIDDEDRVLALLDGDDIVWHGDHPTAPDGSIFRQVGGWYTKMFGTSGHTKIIMGSPSI